MKITYYRKLAIALLPMLVTSLLIMPAQAQSPVSRDRLQKMFADIARNTKWDMSREMLWGYFFTHPNRQLLESVTIELSRLGYRVVGIYLSDKKQRDEPDLWWLHVERVEIHSVESLDARNKELTEFASRHGLASYDGMDVGPADALRK